MKAELLAHLRAHGQEHVLAFWDELDDAARKSLAEQIRRLDLAAIKALYEGRGASEDWAALAARAESPPAFHLDGHGNQFSAVDAQRRGAKALAAGKLAVILVAGGQGTRLGFEHAKGMFPIGPISKATLFQILLEGILARSRSAGARIPLYLMTSPATHDETVEYLASEENFGLAPEDVTIFCQGTMPAIDAESGKLLLAGKGRLFFSPDGHGGMLAALDSSGALADMRRRGIEQVFYTQIDNPLVSMCDPEFIGYHLLAESELSTQVVAKQTSRDKVGNVVVIDGQLRIIEYIDLNCLPDEVVERTDADGAPVFWAGNTANHVLDVKFLERMAGVGTALPFHMASKAVPYVDQSGNFVEPKEPNAIKFERFIFDLLPSARLAVVVEIDERRSFAPVKNAPGDDRNTPESVQAQMVNLHREWLAACGATVAADVPVEISPLFAQDSAELRGKIPSGLTVTSPRYFC